MKVIVEMLPTSTQDMEVDEELKKCVQTSPVHLSTTTPENTNSPKQKQMQSEVEKQKEKTIRSKVFAKTPNTIEDMDTIKNDQGSIYTNVIFYQNIEIFDAIVLKRKSKHSCCFNRICLYGVKHKKLHINLLMFYSKMTIFQ